MIESLLAQFDPLSALLLLAISGLWMMNRKDLKETRAENKTERDAWLGSLKDIGDTVAAANEKVVGVMADQNAIIAALLERERLK